MPDIPEGIEHPDVRELWTRYIDGEIAEDELEAALKEMVRDAVPGGPVRQGPPFLRLMTAVRAFADAYLAYEPRG